ncbi:MAG: hypothetical protein MR775_05150 [Erysipelotrichaceae bacterium]|nr:hypothetical protein [Erysipelotrichaceae bacterium]
MANKIQNNLKIFGKQGTDSFQTWTTTQESEQDGFSAGTIIYASHMNTGLRNSSILPYTFMEVLKNSNKITDSDLSISPSTIYNTALRSKLDSAMSQYITNTIVQNANQLSSAITLNIKDPSNTTIGTTTLQTQGTTKDITLSSTLSNFTSIQSTNFYGINLGSSSNKFTTGYITTLNSTTIYATTIGSASAHVSNAYISSLHGTADNANNATSDEDGNNIKASYGASLSGNGTNTIKLLNKNNTVLGESIIVNDVEYASKIGNSSSHPAIGSLTQPVYVNSDGQLVAGTSYNKATVRNADNCSKFNKTTSIDNITGISINYNANGTSIPSNAIAVNNFYFMTFMSSDTSVIVNFGLVFLGIKRAEPGEERTAKIYLKSTSDAWRFEIKHDYGGISSIKFFTPASVSGRLYYRKLSSD